MYSQIFLVTSVRGSGAGPTTAARLADGVLGIMNAALGLRFAAGFFAADFLAAGFLADDFLAAGVFDAGFFAADFFAAGFFAGPFFAPFLAVAIVLLPMVDARHNIEHS